MYYNRIALDFMGCWCGLSFRHDNKSTNEPNNPIYDYTECFNTYSIIT